MNDLANLKFPLALSGIQRDTLAVGFNMASEPLTGALLRVLVSSRSEGRILELGTGTGVSTAWIVEGMDAGSTLITVDNEAKYSDIAKRHLGHDRRVTFVVGDGGGFLNQRSASEFDLIFADTWPGKYTHLDEALRVLKPGGFYVIDDMLRQASWPEDHAPKVAKLISDLERRADLNIAKLTWASGLVIATKRRCSEC
jgi:predicted O-methyltransferase YrrM